VNIGIDNCDEEFYDNISIFSQDSGSATDPVSEEIDYSAYLADEGPQG
jgi:hypothetical protein